MERRANSHHLTLLPPSDHASHLPSSPCCGFPLLASLNLPTPSSALPLLPGQGAAYPMFPDEDMSCQWDDYGEVIDRDAFAKAAAASSAKGGAIAGALASGGRGSGGRRSPGRDRRDQDRRERDGDRGRRGGRDRGPQGMEVDKVGQGS